MTRLRDLMRITAVRLSAVFLLLFAVFAAVLLLYVTSTAQTLLQSQSRATIAEEITELNQIYEGAGIVGLVRSIDRRSRRPGASLYLVSDASGRILAGNVESIQPGTLDDPGFTQRAFGYARYSENETDRVHTAVAEVLTLSNGMRVLVGRDVSDLERIRLVVRNAVILALVLMTVGALAAWVLVGRTALRRLNRMSASTARIMAGDLHERLPVDGSGDEFDRLSANLNMMLARIALLQEGLRQVSDNIAHDLKTPLTRLRNRVEAGLSGGADERQSRQALEGAMAEADNMIRTFDALLMISRVEAGSHPAIKNRVDLAELVAGVAELYEPLVEDDGGRLDVEAISPLPAVVSRELIAQAVSNLIDNALKYGETAERPLEVRVRVRRLGERVELSVADNGPGIPEDKRDRVLERFYRLDESRTKPGSGLGLSLVQAIARIHDGTMSLSDAGPGLVVTLSFPAGEGEGSDGDGERGSA
ncbi:HAMP domain-containing sensor histidine kinase [Aureimonas sp. AU4]|uniref:sensor histidine kinase n=1 Tax=Aureimonas sp. AU4 TaxID=1638163 RepID=UPI00078285D6|nr:HAMP domain-containing sensor histidine kinase [Aureimonas sp. AU4]